MIPIIRFVLLSSVSLSLMGCGEPPLPKRSQTIEIKSNNKAPSKLDGNYLLKSATGLSIRSVSLKISGNTYFLNAGCNRMSGRLQLSYDGRLKIQPGVSSLMACPDSYEKDVLRLLTQSENYDVSQDSLVVSGSNGVMTFTKSEASE